MTMIRPKIKGLKMTNAQKGAKTSTEPTVGNKGYGDKKGEFLGISKQVR